MGPQAIPQKLYYSIGEVAELVGVKPHVLRYWETEFSFLPAQRDEAAEGFYTQPDVQKIQLIKRLLHEENLSVAAAKKRFRDEKPKGAEAGRKDERKKLVRQIRTQLQGLLDLLGAR